MKVTTIGVAIAKSVFHIHGVDAHGQVLLRRRVARSGFLTAMAQLLPCLIGLEAGSGAHRWARELLALGHDVRLMPPQYVRTYVKRYKHDAADAEACCEAVQRPGMRFIPVKSVEQQATLMLHRVRDHFIRRRTGAINALRGRLAEFGLVAASQRTGLNRLLELVESTGDQLPKNCAEVLRLITTEIRSYDAEIANLDRKLKDKAREEEDVSRRLCAIPGIGPVIARAIPAHMAANGEFFSGRSFAAWLGLPPRQHSSGGRERTYGISKRENSYLSRQLINGARAVVRVARGRHGGLWDWVNRLLERRHFNIVTCAVAAKLARIMWAIITKNSVWRTA